MVAVLILVAALASIWWLGVTSIRHLAANLLASYFLLWSVYFCCSEQRFHEHLARFALASASLGITLGALEAASRFAWIRVEGLGNALDWVQGRQRGEWYGSDLLFVRRPHQRIAGKQQGNIAVSWCIPGPRYSYDLRFDARGFRNEREFSSADVALVGDSFLDDWAVASDQLIGAVLGRLTGLDVVNLGRAAHGPAQELVVLERFAIPLGPKVVVWAFYEGNDLEDLLRYEDLLEERRKERGTGRSLLRDALSLFYERVKLCDADPRSIDQYGTLVAGDGRNTKLMFWTPGHRVTIREERALVMLRRVLSEAHEALRSSGTKMIIAFIPTTFRVYKDLVQYPENSSCIDWVISDLPERIRAVTAAVSADIEFIDLTEALVREARSGSLLYYPDDTHWNAAGHGVAARALAQPVLDRVGAPRLPQ